MLGMRANHEANGSITTAGPCANWQYADGGPHKSDARAGPEPNGCMSRHLLRRHLRGLVRVLPQLVYVLNDGELWLRLPRVLQLRADALAHHDARSDRDNARANEPDAQSDDPSHKPYARADCNSDCWL